MENDTLKKIEALSIQMKELYSAGNIAEYNMVAIEYNSLIESESSENESSESESQYASMLEDYNVEFETLESIHLGILNTLTGIINNTKKGKYSETDKRFFISKLHQCIKTLESIDAEAAKQERLKRKATYSKITERL